MRKLLSVLIVAGAFSALQADVDLVAKCTGCHGKQFEKRALGKSDVVRNMTKEQIITDLKGYRAGTLNKYGMGMLMKGQVATMSDSDIEKMAVEIKGEECNM